MTRKRKGLAVLLGVTLLGAGVAGVVLLRDQAEEKAPPPVCANKPPALVISKQKRSEPFPMAIDDAATYEARFATSCGDLSISLDPAGAPEAVNSVVELVRDRWYNGTPFFRGTAGLAIAGDPTGTGKSTPGFTIDDVDNGSPEVGSVVLWREDPDTGAAQWTVITDPAQIASLPEDLTVIGRIADDSSLDVARKIASVPSPDGPSNERVWILGSRVEEGSA